MAVDAALDWYERAYQTRDFLLSDLDVDPQFQLMPPGQTRLITENPRWMALVERIEIVAECSGVANRTPSP